MVPSCAVASLLGIKRRVSVRARANLTRVSADTLLHTRNMCDAYTHGDPPERRAVQGGPSASGKWVKRINSRWLASRASCLSHNKNNIERAIVSMVRAKRENMHETRLAERKA